MLVYNTSQHNTTKMSSFFANKEFKADILLETQKYKELVPHVITEVNNIYKF